MPKEQDVLASTEGPVMEPPPDPWAPPRANYAQAVSIGTGATGAGLLLGNQPSGTEEGMIAMLPDPTQLFGHLAHVLGFQSNALTSWKLGLILVILSVLLNIYSYFLRYRFATWVKPRWDAQLKDIDQQLARAQAFQQQASTPQAKAQGFVSGDA